jgi:hypothetical protein
VQMKNIVNNSKIKSLKTNRLNINFYLNSEICSVIKLRILKKGSVNPINLMHF